MASLIVSLIVLLIVVALVIYAIDLIPIGDGRIKRLIQALCVLLAALWFASRAGVLTL